MIIANFFEVAHAIRDVFSGLLFILLVTACFAMPGVIVITRIRKKIPPPLPTDPQWKNALWLPISVSLVVAFPLALLFVTLIATYWGYYNIGFYGGNGFALLFMDLPASLGAFTGSGLLIWALRWRFGFKLWSTLLLSLAAMLVVFVCGFAIEVQRTTYYPTNADKNIGEFLRYFIHQRLGF